MKNAPVMDFWVSTSIFLSGQTKTSASTHGKLLHEVVTRRNPPVPPEQKIEIRHPAVRHRSLLAG
ncbi:MAG: hypothetical protein KF712_20545 [Akkermansiaceae bacterium]|nr:hypothetical protein [Akkermansiaceae bacterium]